MNCDLDLLCAGDCRGFVLLRVKSLLKTAMQSEREVIVLYFCTFFFSLLLFSFFFFFKSDLRYLDKRSGCYPYVVLSVELCVFGGDDYLSRC